MIIGLIPSRLDSRRLKQKPLLIIDGLPIVVHAYKRAMLAKKLDKVIVCCDDKKIKDVVEKYGGDAILTSKKHKNGTERIFEVSKKFKAKLIVDIQGDEPLVDPKDIDAVIEFHKKQNFDIVVPCIKTLQPKNPNLVKVIFSKLGKVLYFSRHKMPFNFYDKKINYYKDLSIVSFKPESLKKYCKMPMSPLEKIEGIELIRALENDISIGTFAIKSKSFSVDVKGDLMKAIDVMPRDPVRKLY